MKMSMSLNLTGHFFHKEAELYQKIEPSYLDYGNTGCGVFNPKTRGLFFGEMKFAFSNFLSNEDLSISHES